MKYRTESMTRHFHTRTQSIRKDGNDQEEGVGECPPMHLRLFFVHEFLTIQKYVTYSRPACEQQINRIKILIFELCLAFAID